MAGMMAGRREIRHRASFGRRAGGRVSRGCHRSGARRSLLHGPARRLVQSRSKAFSGRKSAAAARPRPPRAPRRDHGRAARTAGSRRVRSPPSGPADRPGAFFSAAHVSSQARGPLHQCDPGNVRGPGPSAAAGASPGRVRGQAGGISSPACPASRPHAFLPGQPPSRLGQPPARLPGPASRLPVFPARPATREPNPARYPTLAWRQPQGGRWRVAVHPRRSMAVSPFMPEVSGRQRSGREDAERVAGQVGVDPQRFLGIVGAVIQQPGAQG
jgi:hypothetical protein